MGLANGRLADHAPTDVPGNEVQQPEKECVPTHLPTARPY